MNKAIKFLMISCMLSPLFSCHSNSNSSDDEPCTSSCVSTLSSEYKEYKDGFYFYSTNISNGYCVAGIFDDENELDNLEIPSYSPSGYKVIAISSIVGNIKSVTIPSTVETIYSYCFQGCESLESVTFSNGLSSIDKFAFEGCINLKKIELPDSVIGLGEGTFKNCINLKTVKLSTNLIDIPPSLFERCLNLVEIDFPDQIRIINYRAFYDCRNLSKIVFPSNLDLIDMYAFKNCYGLKSIKLNDCDIEKEAFYGCKGIKEISLSEVKRICDNAFVGTSIQSLYIPKTVVKMGSSIVGKGKEEMKFYCEAEAQPKSWPSDWNDGYDVKWGVTREN